jgi:hypothetical protein
MVRCPQHTSHRFRPGERVIWWKRIPGGEYVYPVHVTMTDRCQYERSTIWDGNPRSRSSSYLTPCPQPATARAYQQRFATI